MALTPSRRNDIPRSLRGSARVLLGTFAAWARAASYAGSMLLPPRRRPAPDRRHLLLLVRTFPPLVNGGVYRPLALVRAAVAAGWEVTVVTQSLHGEATPAGLELAAQVPREVEVHPFAPTTEAASFRLSPRVDGGFQNIGPILRAARAVLAIRPASVVLASGPTFAEFVAASILSRREGVPLVLDYRDEWTESQFEFVERGPTDRFWERNCNRAAARVVLVTQALRDHHLSVFKQIAPQQTRVVRNGWNDDREEPAIPAAEPRPLGSRFRLSFFGLVAEHWDLPGFLETLRQTLEREPALKSRLEVRFVGFQSPVEAELLRGFPIPDVVYPIHHVPLPVAHRMMRESDALLVLNSKRSARYVAGKCYEYIAANVPVLVYGRGGEMDALFQGIPGARAVARDSGLELGKALNELISGRVKRELDPDPTLRAAPYRRSVRARELLAVLEEVVSTATGPKPG